MEGLENEFSGQSCLRVKYERQAPVSDLRVRERSFRRLRGSPGPACPENRGSIALL